MASTVSCGARSVLCVDELQNLWHMSLLCNINGDYKNNQPSKIEELSLIKEVSSGGITVCLNCNGEIFIEQNLSFKNLNVPNEIISICCGDKHLLCIDINGKVWGYGRNISGELGLGHTYDQTELTLIESLENIVFVSSRGHFSLFLDADGFVWATGVNTYGQLGLGNRKSISTPEKVIATNQITDISAGYFHSIFLQSNGVPFSCGSYKKSCITSIPTKISKLPNIWKISTGLKFSLFLDFNGQLWKKNNEENKNPEIVMKDVELISSGWEAALIKQKDGTILILNEQSNQAVECKNLAPIVTTEVRKYKKSARK